MSESPSSKGTSAKSADVKNPPRFSFNRKSDFVLSAAEKSAMPEKMLEPESDVVEEYSSVIAAASASAGAAQSTPASIPPQVKAKPFSLSAGRSSKSGTPAWAAMPRVIPASAPASPRQNQSARPQNDAQNIVSGSRQPLPTKQSSIPSQTAPRADNGATPKFSLGSRLQSPTAESLASAARANDIVVTGALTDLKIFNGWGTGRVLDSTGRVISVKGNALAELKIGERYKFSGKKTRHEKFGEQLDVVGVEPDVESLDALIAHMSRNYENVGYKTARSLAEHHQANGTISQLREALIHNPSIVDFSSFTNKEVKLKNDEETQERRVVDSLSIRFSGMGIPQKVMSDLGRWLMSNAVAVMGNEEKKGRDLVSVSNSILDENPYKPISKIERYAFGTADMIASKVGLNKDDPKRIGALVCYALGEGCSSSGHMWLNQPDLFGAIRRIDANLDPMEAVNLAIKMDEPIVVDGSYGKARFYTREMRKYENNLVGHLHRRATMEVDPLCDLDGKELDDEIRRAVSAVGASKGNSKFELDPSQLEALKGILTSRCSLHTLTAGPGCGKTAIVEVLMEIIGHTKNTTFCAPIGKAAKVLNGRIKKWGEAKTIHSTLEFNGKFNRNADKPLDTQLVIADEQSMLGGHLGSAFFDAIPEKAHLLMLGDTGQLAPIEPGLVLKSVLQLEAFDHHRLTTTHRNKGAILSVVNEVGAGSCVARSRDDVIFTGRLPAPEPHVFKKLADAVKKAAEDHGGLDRVGVICPMRKGNASTPGWNVTFLNAMLRDEINPDPDGSKKVTGTNLRVNDRIIVNKNMTIPLVSKQEQDSTAAKKEKNDSFLSDISDIGDLFKSTPKKAAKEEAGNDDNETYVVNGDTGWLEGVEYGIEDGVKKPVNMILRLDDDRLVKFPATELDNLNLSYAITVHAAQGSEYGKVFGIVTDGHEQFMHRAMIFTMFSRAQSELTILGDQITLSKIAARPAPDRNCAIVERVTREMNETIDQPQKKRMAQRA